MFEDFRAASEYEEEEWIEQSEVCLTADEWVSLGFQWSIFS